MKKLLALLFLLPTLAQAADNAVILTPGTGVTMRTIDIGAGVQSQGVNLVGSTGASILGTAGTANTNVITIQGIASGTVVPVSGTITVTGVATAANQTSELTKLDTIISNTAGAIPAGTNAIGSLTAGSAIIGKVGIDQTTPGTTNLVALTSSQVGVGATAAAVPANASYNGLNVGGNLVGQIGDPCQTVAKTYTPISITTVTTTRIVAPAASKKTYVCYMLLTSAAADNVGIVEGTGGTCGSGTAGVVGGTTAANGPNFAANGGVSMGNGGFAVAATAGTNVDLCLITSAATPLAGHIAWVQQ
jgi:hypothetical protein